MPTDIQITHKDRKRGSHRSVKFYFDDAVELSVLHSASVEAAMKHLEQLQLIRREGDTVYARQKQWRVLDGGGVEPEPYIEAAVLRIETNLRSTA